MLRKNPRYDLLSKRFLAVCHRDAQRRQRRAAIVSLKKCTLAFADGLVGPVLQKEVPQGTLILGEEVVPFPEKVLCDLCRAEVGHGYFFA